MVETKGGDDYAVEMFHAHLDKKSEINIPLDFSSSTSRVRCLISTVAFGLGMQVDNVSYVIHWGPPKCSLDYIQEVGRCARNGMKGYAIMYKPPYSIRSDMINPDMMNIIRSSEKTCIRYSVLSSLRISDFTHEEIVKCCYGERCCSVCDTKTTQATNSTL